MGCANSAGVVYESPFQTKYDLGCKLGEGGFAQVRAVRSRETKEELALKTLKLCPEPSKSSLALQKAAEREEAVWRRLGNHRHCVQLFECYVEEFSFHMVMERCQASVLERLDSLRSSGDVAMSRVLGEMLLGLEFVHSQGIVHRDIKPGNFLLGGPDGQTVKICDFGLAVMMPDDGLLFGSCGSPSYMSPEVVAKSGYTSKTDVWSLGVTAYVLLYGALPYVKPHGDNREAIQTGLPAPTFKAAPGVQNVLHASAASLVKLLLERCQHTRCTAVEALQHEFLLSHSSKCSSKSIDVDICDASTNPGSESSINVSDESSQFSL